MNNPVLPSFVLLFYAHHKTKDTFCEEYISTTVTPSKDKGKPPHCYRRKSVAHASIHQEFKCYCDEIESYWLSQDKLTMAISNVSNVSLSITFFFKCALNDDLERRILLMFLSLQSHFTKKTFRPVPPHSLLITANIT